MNRALIALLCSALAACAHAGRRENRPFAQQEGDFGLIAGAALEIIERHAPVTEFVVPPGLDPHAREALAHRRKVVATSAGPAPLPAGYFRVDIFRIDADGAALFEGDLGPTGCAAASPCGRNFSIPFVVNGDDWFNPSYKIIDYAQHREVIPAN
jgi:hypothetical protein